MAVLLVPVASGSYGIATATEGGWPFYAIGNGVAVLAISLTWVGARRFGGRPPRHWIALALPLAMVALVIAFDPRRDAWVGIVPFLFLFAAFCFLASVEFWRGAPLEPRGRNARILTFTASLTGLFYLARGIAALVGGPQGVLFDTVFSPEVATLVLLLLVVTSSLSLMSLGKERADRKVSYAATHDALTDVLNRREFEQRLTNVGSGKQAPNAVLLLDLDHFKQINDRFGHLVGDQALASFARLACAALRKGDLFCRFGGEEFAAFLPGADRAVAAAIGERIRLSLRDATDPVLVATNATVSIGVAVSEEPEPLTSLLTRADQALYRAKARGRDRVE